MGSVSIQDTSSPGGGEVSNSCVPYVAGKYDCSRIEFVDAVGGVTTGLFRFDPIGPLGGVVGLAVAVVYSIISIGGYISPIVGSESSEVGTVASRAAESIFVVSSMGVDIGIITVSSIIGVGVLSFEGGDSGDGRVELGSSSNLWSRIGSGGDRIDDVFVRIIRRSWGLEDVLKWRRSTRLLR